jgi:transcriptional regulator with XRE-family HTH domain
MRYSSYVDQARVRRQHSGSSEPLDPTRVIAERVAAIRRYRGLTQEALAEAMQGLGIDWERIVVAKLESGRRGFLRVDELLALCVVLEIAPVDLLVPASLDDDQPYRIVPNGTARAVNAREFVRGEELLFLSPYPEPEQDPDSLWAEPVGLTVVDTIQWMPADRGERVDRRYRDIEEEDQS